MILEDPIESWPIVETLISFFSEGFPLNKAIAYVIELFENDTIDSIKVLGKDGKEI